MWCESLHAPPMLGMGPSASSALAAYRQLQCLVDGVRSIRSMHAALTQSAPPLEVRPHVFFMVDMSHTCAPQPTASPCTCSQPAHIVKAHQLRATFLLLLLPQSLWLSAAGHQCDPLLSATPPQ